jgi:hypothetical protein
MLTLDEIQRLNINPVIVKEGVKQASERLGDALETKRGLEQKALALLAGYVTISFALFSLAGTLGQAHPLFYAFIIAGCILLAGIVALFLSLRPLNYGTLGRYPDTWLQPNTLDGDDGTFARIMASVLHGYQARLSVSDYSNKRKAQCFSIGVLCGALSPFVFLISIMALKHFS